MGRPDLMSVSVFIANTFISWGNSFAEDAMWSVQDLMQRPRCPSEEENVTDAQLCCATCLGFSATHYNLLTGLPFLWALPVVLYSGVLIERLGVARCALAAGLCCVLGNAVRLAGALLGDTRWLALAVMLAGEIVFFAAYQVVYIVRNCVASQCFPRRVRPLAVGVSLAGSCCGSLVAFWTMNSLGHRAGIPVVLAAATGAVTLTPTCAAVLLLFDKSLAARRRSEHADDEEAPGGATLATIARTLRAPRTLLLVALAGLNMACVFSFLANSVLLLVGLARVAARRASFYVGAFLIVMGVTNAAFGALLGRLLVHAWTIALGGGLSTAGFLLLLLAPHLHPMPALGLIAGGASTTFPSALSYLAEVAPKGSYGSAVAVASIICDLGVALLNGLTGVLVDRLPGRQAGWAAVLAVLASCAASVAVGGLVLAVTGRRRPPSDSAASTSGSSTTAASTTASETTPLLRDVGA